MTTIYVQFSDITEKVIQNSFAGPQDTSVPYQGVVESNDPRWKVFYDMFPSWDQANMVTPD